jgi:hypothetical protein
VLPLVSRAQILNRQVMPKNKFADENNSRYNDYYLALRDPEARAA